MPACGLRVAKAENKENAINGTFTLSIQFVFIPLILITLGI